MAIAPATVSGDAAPVSHDGTSPTITVVGSLNVDLVIYTPRLPAGGETLTANEFQTHMGGKGANQAVACAKLSRSKSRVQDGTATIKMVGCVGADTYGQDLIQGLGTFGMDTAGISTRQDSKTGVAVIVVDEKCGENRIMFSPEANYALQPDSFRTLDGPLPSLIVLQMEIPLETVLAVIATARRQYVPVLLNAAPAQKIPHEHYRGLAHLVVNESEAAVLADCDESRLDNEAGIEAVANQFRALGVQNVLITLGGRGVYYVSKDGRRALVPAEKANVIDTTAAGDTFIGAYALEVVKVPFDVERAVIRANRAAAKTVERKGAQSSIPWLDEIE